MLLPKNNLVAIAYKTGYCGSLVYALLALSSEVKQYVTFDKLSFDNGTAHEVKEEWFNNLHDYQDSVTFGQSQWESCVPPATQQALMGDELILFRCHPNIAYKLSFIENLKVLYVTHQNKYVPERWAYEKVYKPMGDEFYQKDLQRLLNTQKILPVSNQMKRMQLIKNLNHHVVGWQEIKTQMKTQPYLVEIDQLLEKNFSTYQNLCGYLKVTAMPQTRFNDLINKYNSKQWKRF